MATVKSMIRLLLVKLSKFKWTKSQKFVFVVARGYYAEKDLDPEALEGRTQAPMVN